MVESNREEPLSTDVELRRSRGRQCCPRGDGLPCRKKFNIFFIVQYRIHIQGQLKSISDFPMDGATDAISLSSLTLRAYFWRI